MGSPKPGAGTAWSYRAVGNLTEGCGRQSSSSVCDMLLAFDCLTELDRSEHSCWIGLRRASDFDRLNHVKTALAILELRHGRLRTAQPLGKANLRQAEGAEGTSPSP